MLDSITEAQAAGCSVEEACAQAGVSSRTVARWRKKEGHGDGRQGPLQAPTNALSPDERSHILDIANSPEFRDCSPKQIVPRLADRDEYVGSESSFYRVLREEEQLAHREPSKVRTPRPLATHTATAPNQVYSWDITYLPASVRGAFYFLYLVMDIWSRKVIGWAVHEAQSPDLAAALFQKACKDNGVDPAGIILHSDNGDPMKGTTMLRMLQDLGVIPSFSRPSVSNDNAFSEALFKTVKFRPGYPGRFESIADAIAWVTTFVEWYDTEHRHSSIRYVTPAERHAGKDVAILQRRDALYARARARRPDRWSGEARNWTPIGAVHLNPRNNANQA